MTRTYVLMQNLNRNPLRTMLTAAAFALPMAIFVAAISLVVTFMEVARAAERELRLGVHHRTSLTQLLPEAMRRRIEGLDPRHERLSGVCGMRWFGGRVPDSQNTLTSLAADVDTFPLVYSDLGLTPEEIEEWRTKRTAAVVGPAPAKEYGWTKGSRVVLESTVPPYLALEFHVIKVVDNKERGNVFYFRRDYMDESLEQVGADSGRCHIFWLKCNSAAALRLLQKDIDALFSNSPEETKSEDENAFAANFTQAGGDIPGLMRAMAIVVLGIVALVAGNTMMMSLRERTRELAVFKAIGFQRGRIFSIVLAESVMLAVGGALIGVVPAALFLWKFPIQRLRMGPIAELEVSGWAVVVSLVIALLVGVAAGLWPAYQAMRLNTVDALRRIA
ncbi:MAG: ABC transporter permease [Planctomycetota bacterium]